MTLRTVTFRGRKFTLCNPGPYYRANSWGKGPSNLHRAVWTHYRGEIPEGHNVHHLDGDKTNNKLSNLELIDHAEHARIHTTERQRTGVLKPPGKLCRERALEELKTRPLSWRKKMAKFSWKVRVWHDLICTECGKPYQSPYPNKSKFCHLNCRQAALRKRRGIPVRGRRVVT